VNVINIGKYTGKTMLDQVLEQLQLDEERDYVWWNGNTSLKVVVPESLQDNEAFATLDKRSNSAPSDGSLRR
jgi:hypothetical protein